MYEAAIVEVMTKMIAFARVIYETHHSYRVSAPGTALLEKIDWRDIDLKEDEMVIDIRPASPLPLDAAGRVETVQELVKSGVFDQAKAAQAIDDLDPDATMSLARAAEKSIERQIDLMLVDGKPQFVDKFDDLQAAIKIGTLSIKEAGNEGVAEENIDLVRRYVEDAEYQLQKAKPAQPPAAPMPAPVPQAQSLAH
jgi:hypothetical protein